jgi:hypothetical protein
MHRAVTSSGLVAVLALVLVAPASCAKGNDPSTAEVVPSTTSGDAGPDAACAPCFADQVCSSGACVGNDTDADKDGVKAGVDCDDHDPAIHPGAAEICNGKDDNCDGKIDEGFDVDNDGTPSCAVGGKPADCDDHDPAIHPGAAETCNGKDDNCDGKVDEGFDADNDGFYACAHGTIPADCDDTSATIHPGAPETCNNKDDNCNSLVDEIPANLSGQLSSPINPHWQLVGSAGLSGAGSATYAQLTSDAPDQAGALWWNALYTFDAFDMTATFWIQNKPTGADGMAFAWVLGGNFNQVGTGANGFGAGGLNGYAVAIDTFQNNGDPAVPYLAILQNSSPPTTLLHPTLAIPNVRDSANHTLRVKLGAGGKVSVWLDSINYVNEFAIPGYVPFIGHWGFTGATGGSSETHFVKDITMSFPDGQGCVP